MRLIRLTPNPTNMRRSRHFCKTDAASLITAGILILVCTFYPYMASADSSVKPQEIPEFLTQKGKNLSALKAAMNISSIYDGGKSRQDVKGFLLYRRPSDFRFQGVATGGNSLFEL